MMTNDEDRSTENSDSNGKVTPGEVADLSLARTIKNLDSEIQPERDLWQGIERQIQDYPQKRKIELPGNWMPYGVAASLLVAFAALFVNLAMLNNANQQFASSGNNFDRINAEYVQVRNPLVQKFTEVNKNLDEQTLSDLYRNLDILEQARKDIEAQVRENPDNQRLVESLMRIHKQELDLLKQDYSQPGHFM